VFSSSDHVIHGGPKYTISSPGRGMSVDYKSVFRLAISFFRSGAVHRRSRRSSEN